MIKKTILSFLLMAAVSQASVKELIPKLTSDNLEVQTQARLDLLASCSKAGAPDAPEGARKAICLEMCGILDGNYPTVEVVQPMLNNLERIGGAESVPTLLRFLNHPDEHIRDDARRALSTNPSDEAAAALGAKLKNRKARTPQETAGLIYALGERKQPGASKLIAGALGSNDDRIFIAAVKTLGMLNEDAGIEAMLAHRGRVEGLRKIQLDAALLSSGRASVYAVLLADEEADEVRAAAMLELILSGESSHAAGAMSSGDRAQQLGAIEAARQGLDPVVLDAVAEQMGGLPAALQIAAVTALEVSGNRNYGAVVEPLLQSDDALVRASAAQALAKVGTAESVPSLVALGSGDALRALGRLDVDGVDVQLDKLAAAGDTQQRCTAIEALANRGRVDMIPTFFEYVEDEDRAVASAAARAIAHIGDDATVETMVDVMILLEKAPVSRDLLEGIVKLMRTSSDQGALADMMVSKMDGASARSQANILKAMAQSGSKAALDPLEQSCRSSDEQLQKTAVKALSGWKEVNGIETMIRLASDDGTSTSDHVTLMRGVSRIYASTPLWKLPRYKGDIEQAIATCRRDEEKAALQATLDKIN